MAALSLLVGLPFIDQAFHVDDPNFLALAAHASPHPLHLYDFHINWGGSQERAFDILANPPLVPWYLALVSWFAGGHEWVYHLAFLPFLFLALLGTANLGARFAEGRWPVWTALATGVSPAVVLASHAVMPDMPLVAGYVWGVYLSVSGMDTRRYRRAIAGGLLAGLSGLCRYSGLTAIPLLALYGLLTRRRSRGVNVAAVVASALPIGAWSLASWGVYGQVHLLAMTHFETQSVGIMDLLNKTGYQAVSIGLCIVGGTAWPVLFKRGRRVRMFTVVVAVVAVAWGCLARLTPFSTVWLAAGLVGCFVLAVEVLEALRAGLTRRGWAGRPSAHSDDLFLSLWILGVLVFNAWLLFASVRYLLPLVPPSILLLERRLAAQRAAAPVVAVALLMSGLVAFGLSTADEAFADTYRRYAASLPAIQGQRWFVGHWGLQYYLEKKGARALAPDEGPLVQPGDEIIVPTYSWPQDLPEGLELEVTDVERFEYPTWFRTFSVEGAACFYANWLSPGPTQVWLPYTVADGPLETLKRLKVVRRVGGTSRRPSVTRDLNGAP